MYQKASRMKLRFKTDKGLVTVEDVWDLPLTKLDTIAKALRRTLQDDRMDSFITEERQPDVETELRFDIVKDIILVRLAEKKSAETAVIKRQKRAQIMNLIEDKKSEALKDSTIEELMDLLDKL